MSFSMFFTIICSLLLAFPSHAQLTSDVRLPSPCSSKRFAGAVYAMTNDVEENSIEAYGRLANGTLISIGSFRTGGQGAILDMLDGVDPLFAAFSLLITPDNRFIFAVNAGSRSISTFAVQRDFSLKLTSVRQVSGFGPVSVAYYKGLIYVASIEAGNSLPEGFPIFAVKGSLTGFRLTKKGKLIRIPASVRLLPNRPSAIRFSPDGRSLLVTSVAAGSVQLDTDVVEELYSFRVLKNGRLSRKPVSVVTSTELNNTEERSLPTAIGFDTARVDGVQYAVVSESRVVGFNGEGENFQTSSISIWKITATGKLIPSQLEVLVGSSVSDGQQAACWVEFSKSKSVFWVANTLSGSISAFSFNAGKAELVEEVAVEVSLPIDLWRSSDGKFLYQLSSNGMVNGFEIGRNGLGPSLTSIQTVQNLPDRDVQGIVAI